MAAEGAMLMAAVEDDRIGGGGVGRGRAIEG